MEKFKIIKEIKPKVKVIDEVKKVTTVRTETTVENVPIDHVSSSRERPSVTLDKIESQETTPTNTFREKERDLEERETRFYESTRRQESRMSYQENSKEELVGNLGVASAHAAPASDLTDRSSLLRNSGRANALDSGPQAQTDRTYELKGDSTMHTKRRKELY